MKKHNRNHINCTSSNNHHLAHPSRCNPKINQQWRRHHYPSSMVRIRCRIHETGRTKRIVCCRQTNG